LTRDGACSAKQLGGLFFSAGPATSRLADPAVDSTHVCLGYGIRIEEVAPAREFAITHSEKMEEVGLAGLAGGANYLQMEPGDRIERLTNRVVVPNERCALTAQGLDPDDPELARAIDFVRYSICRSSHLDSRHLRNSLY
jgi:hypothetical protein